MTTGESAEAENDLWTRWHTAREAQARKLLAEQYLPYARALAAKIYARRTHSEFEFDEYLHFAVVGMMESLDQYIPGGGAHFKTFATPRINGAILNGLNQLSERQQQLAFCRRLARERVAALRLETVSSAAGPQLLEELSQVGIGLALGFLLEGTGMFVRDDAQLPDNAYSHIELRQLQERIWQLVEQLTEREAQVIHQHYLQRKNFDEVATALRLSRGRISQLHAQALARLGKSIRAGSRCDVVL